jgi:futalosine hydrolase
MILVVCAVEAELSEPSFRQNVEIRAIGIGPVEAAAATARALATTRYQFVINAGIGGAFRGRATLGDAVVVTHEAFAELGFEDGADVALPRGVRLIRTIAADPLMLARLRALPYPQARGVTVASITTSDARARALTERYDATVESMEGFAVLRAAALAGVRAVEIRGISNYVGERTRSEWNFRRGATAAREALEAALDLLATEQHV